MSQAIAAMREKIMGTRASIADTTSSILDGNDGLVSKLASLAADVASRISGEKDALKFAAEGALSQTADVDEKTVRMKNKIAGEMGGMQVVGKKTESQLDNLIMALDTTNQNIAAKRNIYKLQKHKDDMIARLEERVGSLKAKLATLLGAATFQGSGMLEQSSEEVRKAIQGRVKTNREMSFQMATYFSQNAGP